MDGRGKESLADYVRRVRAEEKLSLNEVSEQSGGRISNAYVSRIENGFVKSPSSRMLNALAKGLGRGEEEVFAVARGKREPPGFREGQLWELHVAIESIDKKAHRHLIDELIEGVIRMVRALPKKTTDPRPAENIRKTK